MSKLKNVGYAILTLTVIYNWSDKITRHKFDTSEEFKFHPEKLKEMLFPHQVKETEEENTQEDVLGNITLKANRKGHFRGDVIINGVEMPFIVDTGATYVGLSMKIASKAGIPIGEMGRSSTANGNVTVMVSTIKELKIGNATLKNVKTTVHDSMDEVLLGMSVLNRFNMKMEDGTMTLTSKNPSSKLAQNTETEAAGENLEAKDGAPEDKDDTPEKETLSPKASKPKWTRKTVCNEEGNDCKTVYSE